MELTDLFEMRFNGFRVLHPLILLLCVLSAHGQERANNSSARSLTYGFVSPNTREGLKLEDAIRGLQSAEEQTLIRHARSFRCVARSKVEAYKSVGSWSDGAEHGVMLRAHTDSLTMRYLISVLGRAAQQKAALYFHSDSAGESEMYILRPRNRLGAMRRIAQALDEAGIEFRTLVPLKATVLVYVVDVKSELRAKISAAATKLKARITERRGSAEFIGNDSSREKAQAIFDAETKSYESTNAPLIRKCRTNEN